MEIVADNEEEVGIVLTHREFRLIMEIYGEAESIPELRKTWEVFSKWLEEYDYEYIVSKANKGPYSYRIR